MAGSASEVQVASAAWATSLRRLLQQVWVDGGWQRNACIWQQRMISYFLEQPQSVGRPGKWYACMHECGKCLQISAATPAVGQCLGQSCSTPSGPSSQALNLGYESICWRSALVYLCKRLHDRWSFYKSAPICGCGHQQAAQTCATRYCVETLRHPHVGGTHTCGRRAGTSAAGGAFAQPTLSCQAANTSAARGNAAARP